MNNNNSTRREITINLDQANRKALFFLLPNLLLFGLPYVLLWSETITIDNVTLGSFLLSLSIALLILFLGIVAHELIHGIFWAIFAKHGFRSIQFGVYWKYLTPYCHCSDPMKIRQYKIGAIMPGVLLGIIPSILSLIIGSFPLILFGIFFTFAASGDFLIVWILRKEDNLNLVLDHPSKIGCIVFDKKEESDHS